MLIDEFDVERGRIDGSGAMSQMLSGSPPKDWGDPIDPPSPGESAGALELALQALMFPWCDRLRLHYTSCTTRRRTVHGSVDAPIRSSSEWALVASVIPLG